MTWTTLHDKARQLGFDLACHASSVEDGSYGAGLSSPPSADQSWICIGSYGEVAGLWAQPLTPQARAMAPGRVAAMISGCCRHVGTLADYDEEFRDCLAPVLAAVAHPEYGQMPS